MNASLQNKLRRMTIDLMDCCDCPNKHFSFLLDNTRIVSVGWNTYKTHPKAKQAGYVMESSHSELSALLKFRGNKKDLRHLTLVNTRVNTLKQFGYSHPCLLCMQWIQYIGFHKIFYTNVGGEFSEK